MNAAATVAKALDQLLHQRRAPDGELWSAKSLRSLSAAIKASNGGRGPSHQTLLNLLEGTGNPKPETLWPIIRCLDGDPTAFGLQTDPVQDLAFQLSDVAREDRDPAGLREAALNLAALPPEVFEDFRQKIAAAAAAAAAGAAAPRQPVNET
ncbi:hypothetical protein ACQPYK_49280 (plasmid) [Streptosporangium sp. CA-135522]|uniref:hypothetical protein n=1 Tax=Streptosporangium sp. CA-135522 TaxID=3240072 RepID=UPI003D91792A